MIYMHEDNINNKINQTVQNGKKVNGYNNKKTELQQFKKDVYLPFKEKMNALTFEPKTIKSSIITATTYINDYYKSAKQFAKDNNIKSQSKFLSTILEEISCYLFKDIEQIVSGQYGIFNHSICSGIMIENGKVVKPITKDVDFCIGIKAPLSFGSAHPIDVVVPIVAVEVKTYLDATMFGEIKSSTREIQSITPCAKTYVLIGYNQVKDAPLLVARNQTNPTEIFALQKNESQFSKNYINDEALLTYWNEVYSAVQATATPNKISSPGKLLHP